MTELFTKIVNMSITASILAAVVLILRLALRKAPKWIHVLLWGLVAVRLVCPFSIESTFSLMPETEWVGQNDYKWADNTPQEITPDPVAVTLPDNNLSITYTDNDPDIAANRGIRFTYLLPYIWLAGIVLLLLYTGVSYHQVYRQVKPAAHLRENIHICGKVSSPFVFGIVRPKICLPAGLDEISREYVIAHEQAHIRRCDHWWKPFGFLLLTIHWFNPVMWLSYGLLCRDIEMACDERVVRDMGDAERADYSQALLECSVSRRMLSACPLAFGEVDVKARIKSVLYYKKPTFRIVGIAVVVCAAAAVCFLTNPASKTTDIRSIPSETLPETENTEIWSAIAPNDVWDFKVNPEYFFSGITEEEIIYSAHNFVYDIILQQDFTITLQNHGTAPLHINIHRTSDNKIQETVSVKSGETVSVVLSCGNVWFMTVDTAWYANSQAEFSGWIHVQEETGQQDLLSAYTAEEKKWQDAYLDAKAEEEKLNAELDRYLQSNSGNISAEEIESLLNSYLLYEQYTVYDSASMNISAELDESGMYSKVIDEAYDTWDEWIAFIEGIFCGEELEQQLNRQAELYIEIDGYTYCRAGSMGWYLSKDYTYAITEEDSSRIVLRLTRSEVVPGTFEPSPYSVDLILTNTDHGWRISG